MLPGTTVELIVSESSPAYPDFVALSKEYELIIRIPASQRLVKNRAFQFSRGEINFAIKGFSNLEKNIKSLFSVNSINNVIFHDLIHAVSEKIINSYVNISISYENLIRNVINDFGDLVYRFKIGLVYLRDRLLLKPFDPRYFVRDLAGWNQGNWQSLPDTKGKRIAVIIPGTFTWRLDTFVKNERFIQLSNWLMSINLKNANRKFFDYVLGFEYDDILSPPEESGRILGESLKNLLSKGASLYLFGHSQGGLVSRWAIEKAGASDVTMLVMIGTPNKGIPFDYVETVELAMDRLDRLSGYLDSPAMNAMKIYGDSIEDSSIEGDLYTNQSEFLQTLNYPVLHTVKTNYYTVSGRRSLEDFVSDSNNDIPDSIGASFYKNQKRGFSDGTISLSSAKGEGIDWKKHCNGLADEFTWEHRGHSDLPRVADNALLGTRIVSWLMKENSSDVNVHVE